MKRLMMTMLLPSLVAGGARLARGAEEALPPVADVVKKAQAVVEKKVDNVVCKVVVDTQLLDKTGKPEHDEHREGKATFRNDDMDIESLKVTRDGKALTADELADERAKVQKDKKKRKKGEEDFDLLPLSAKNAPGEAFELVRKETLWGRPALSGQGARAEEVAEPGRRHLVGRRRELRDAEGGAVTVGDAAARRLDQGAAAIRARPQGRGGAVLPTHRGRGAHVDDAQAIPHDAALDRLPLTAPPPRATIAAAWHFAGPSGSS